MAINFTRLFTTLGYHVGALNELNTFRGTTLGSRATTLTTQYVSAVAVYGDLVSGLTGVLANARSASDGYVADLKSHATTALVNEVVADRPLTNASTTTALAELRRQMIIGGESLNDCPGTVTVAAVGSPVGDPTFVFGTKDPVTGKTTDFIVPDVYLIQCSGDRSNGGSAFACAHSVVGKPADALPTDASYPSGTGIDTAFTETDPATDGGLVTNGGFSDWTVTNTPDDWTLGASTLAGTHVFQKSTDGPRGVTASDKSLRLVGDGSVLVKLRQAVTVTPNTAYTVHFRVKKVADPGTDWGVTVRLVDASFAALAGPGALVNSVTSATAGSVASDWTNVSTGQFVTPTTLPTAVYVEIVFHQFSSVSTAPASGAEVYVSHVSVQSADTIYEGGPSLVVFSGTTDSVQGDARTATAALTSGVPKDYLIRGIDRLIGLAGSTTPIPTVSGGGETQTDALIV